jgi:uncharacterized ubiquitin-like protein YukD
MKKFFVLLLASSILLLNVPVASAETINLLTNGSFESGAGGWSTDDGCGVEIWQVGTMATNGSRIAELNSCSQASYWQDVEVTPGSFINFSFDHRGRDSSNEVLQATIAPAANPAAMFASYIHTATRGIWTRGQLETYIPFGVNVIRVQVRAMSGGSQGNLIDNLVLTGVQSTAVKASITTDKDSYIAGDTVQATLHIQGANTISNGGIDTSSFVINYDTNRFSDEITYSSGVANQSVDVALRTQGPIKNLIVLASSNSNGTAGNIVAPEVDLVTINLTTKQNILSQDLGFYLSNIIILTSDTNKLSAQYITDGNKIIHVTSKLDQATQAVVVAEGSQSTIADLDYAQGLVVALVPGLEKDLLQTRLNWMSSQLHADPALSSDSLVVQGQELRGFNPNNVIYSSTLENNTSRNRNVRSVSIITANPNGAIGTGTIVNLEGFDGQTHSYTVIINGDLDGDGQVNLIDYATVKQYILGMEYITNPLVQRVADLNGDGIIDAADLIKIKKQIQGSYTISQN